MDALDSGEFDSDGFDLDALDSGALDLGAIDSEFLVSDFDAALDLDAALGLDAALDLHVLGSDALDCRSVDVVAKQTKCVAVACFVRTLVCFGRQVFC